MLRITIFLWAICQALTSYVIDRGALHYWGIWGVLICVVSALAAFPLIYAALPAGKPTGDRARGIQSDLDTARGQIKEIVKQGLPKVPVEGISLHCWMVPNWYVSSPVYKFRRSLVDRIPELEDYLPDWIYPSLIQIARSREFPLESLGIRFRKGTGVPGLALTQGNVCNLYKVDFRNQEIQDALSSAKVWKDSGYAITQNLSRGKVKRAASRYLYVAGTGILARENRDRIAVLTIEMARCEPKFQFDEPHNGGGCEACEPTIWDLPALEAILAQTVEKIRDRLERNPSNV